MRGRLGEGMLTAKRLPVAPLRRRPRVSVAIPNYNYARYLPETIESALDQPGIDVDVLVVDNASTDDSVEVVRRLANADPRVRIIVHSTNEGQIASFNEAVQSTTGEYVVMLCSDDLLTPGSLTRSAALLEAHPNVGFTYGFPRSFTDKRPEIRTDVTGWSVWAGRKWFDARYKDARNVITSPEVLMRRSLVDQVRFDTRYPERSDLLLWLRGALLGDVGRVHGPCQALQRIHDARLSNTEYGGLLPDLESRRGVFDLVLDEDASGLADVQRLRVAVHRALARESVLLARRCHDLEQPVGGSSAEEYAKFAVDIWPEICGSTAWKAYQVRARGHAPKIVQVGAEQAHRVRHHLQWRLWRRYGI